MKTSLFPDVINDNNDDENCNYDNNENNDSNHLSDNNNDDDQTMIFQTMHL